MSLHFGVKLGLGEIEFSLSNTAQAAFAPYVRAFSANFADFAICVSNLLIPSFKSLVRPEQLLLKLIRLWVLLEVSTLIRGPLSSPVKWKKGKGFEPF